MVLQNKPNAEEKLRRSEFSKDVKWNDGVGEQLKSVVYAAYPCLEPGASPLPPPTGHTHTPHPFLFSTSLSTCYMSPTLLLVLNMLTW